MSQYAAWLYPQSYINGQKVRLCRRTERGAASIELVLLTPVLLAMLLLVVAGGRMTNARADLDAAARDGARAASLARTPLQARNDAETAIAAALDSRDLSCDSPTTDIDVGNLTPGSLISVAVHCEVSLADLTSLPLPSSRTMNARFVEVVDTHRQVRS